MLTRSTLRYKSWTSHLRGCRAACVVSITNHCAKRLGFIPTCGLGVPWAPEMEALSNVFACVDTHLSQSIGITAATQGVPDGGTEEELDFRSLMSTAIAEKPSSFVTFREHSVRDAWEEPLHVGLASRARACLNRTLPVVQEN